MRKLKLQSCDVELEHGPCDCLLLPGKAGGRCSQEHLPTVDTGHGYFAHSEILALLLSTYT